MSNEKILILAAVPDRLRIDQQIREIESAIKRAVKRDLFEIKIRTAVRPQDIRRAIAEERPQIVHFCGHGQEDGSLLLEDDGGNHKPILPTGLAALFKLHSDYVKCVLLNACYSSLPASAISKHINYVIGTNQPIEDRAAIVFAQGFYDGLGYDNVNNLDVIQRAFDEGIVAIQLENLLQVAVPSLWKKVNHQFVSNSIFSTQSIQLISNHQRNNSIKLAQIPLQKNHVDVTSDEESELDVDYTALKEFIQQNKFKEADFETTRIMLWIANRLTDQILTGEDFQDFPLLDLTTINKLWLTGSNNKFGFSIQKQIWIKKGGNPGKYTYQNFRRFVEELKWEKDDIPCDLRAKKGYLPKGIYYVTRKERGTKTKEKYLREYNEFYFNVLDEERNRRRMLEIFIDCAYKPEPYDPPSQFPCPYPSAQPEPVDPYFFFFQRLCELNT